MMKWTAAPGLAVALTMVVGPHGVAVAQVDTHSNAPIDITADQAEVSNARCVAIWRGAAEAVQDRNRLRADTLTVYSSPKAPASPKASASNDRPAAGPLGGGGPSCGGVERIEADGHVYFVTPDQNARGDHAVFTQASDEVVITGDVIVVQGLDVARGDRLTIDLASHQATMASTVTGAGRPGRVRAVVYPNRPAPATGAAKP